MTDIGVKVKTKRFLGTADLTLTKLKEEMNCKAIFLGLGNPNPKIIPMFKDLTEQQGFYTSKSFLPKVRMLSKKFFAMKISNIFFFFAFFRLLRLLNLACVLANPNYPNFLEQLLY